MMLCSCHTKTQSYLFLTRGGPGLLGKLKNDQKSITNILTCRLDLGQSFRSGTILRGTKEEKRVFLGGIAVTFSLEGVRTRILAEKNSKDPRNNPSKLDRKSNKNPQT